MSFSLGYMTIEFNALFFPIFGEEFSDVGIVFPIGWNS